MTKPSAPKIPAMRFYLAAALFLAGGILAYIFYVRATLFWDFRTYFCAAYIFRVGQNPYDTSLLASVAGQEGLAYIYPALTLWFFVPFTYIDWDLMLILWPGVISALLGLTIWLWQRRFLQESPAPRLIILSLLAFNLTIPKNIITGNITALELLLIWCAFASLLRGDVTKFVALVVASAAFKMTPIVFLAVPLLHPQLRSRWKTVFAGAAAFAAYLVANYVLWPKWFVENQQNISSALREWALKDFFNSSVLSIGRRLMIVLFPSLSETASVFCSYIFYGAIIAPVLWISWKVLRSLSKRNWSDIGVPLILYTTLIYALIMPRMLDYTFGIVIPATLYVIEKILPRERALYFIIALLLPVPFISFPSFAIPGDFFFGYWGYWNVLMVLVSWMLFSRNLCTMAQSTLQKLK